MIRPQILEQLRVITKEEQSFLNGETAIDRDLYMADRDSVISHKKLISNGKLIAIRPHARFVHFPEHSHDFIEIIYMCSGTTTHVINGERLVLREGEILFLCQNARQEILPAGKDDIAVNFIIHPDFFNTIFEIIGQEDTPIRNFLLACLRNDDNQTGFLHFMVSDVIPIQNLIENMIATLIYDTPNKRNINQLTMGLLFLQLINHADKSTTQEEDFTLKILHYIEEHYRNGSLSELAELLHYDISTLSRKIKTKTGKTYTELLHEKRLSQASFLLKNTNIKIQKISEMIGYESLSFFHRFFKKKYGIAPQKYRKSLHTST